MSPDPRVGLVLSLAGIVGVVLGFAGYVGLMAMGKGLSTAMGVVGVVAIISSYVYTFHYDSIPAVALAKR